MDWPIWMWPAIGLYLAGSWVKHKVMGDTHYNCSTYQISLLKKAEASGDYCYCRSCERRRNQS